MGIYLICGAGVIGAVVLALSMCIVSGRWARCEEEKRAELDKKWDAIIACNGILEGNDELTEEWLDEFRLAAWNKRMNEWEKRCNEVEEG